MHIYSVCCAEESKFSISAKIAKCRPENKCILHGQFALICLIFFFAFVLLESDLNAQC